MSDRATTLKVREPSTLKLILAIDNGRGRADADPLR